MGTLSLITMLQIFCEMLPVSSSGHVALYQMFAPGMAYNTSVVNAWMHFIHFPTLIIISAYLFFKKISWNFLRRYAPTIVIADGITGLTFLSKKYVQIPEVPLSVGFLITAALLASLYFIPRERPSLNDAGLLGLLLGCVQSCALLIPGLSRLGAVFVTLAWVGFAPTASFTLAWLIQVPLMTLAVIRATAFLWREHVLGDLIFDQLGALSIGTIGSLATLCLGLYVLPAYRWYYFSLYLACLVLCLMIWSGAPS